WRREGGRSLAHRYLGIAANSQAELGARVVRVVGSSNSFTTTADKTWRDTRRNPWIAEGIGHLLLFLAGQRNTGCLNGLVAALKSLHAIPTQQGLDLVAIYLREDLPVLATGESKATRADPGGQLTEAAGFFRDIEAHERDGELVADIAMLEPFLAPATRD